MRKRSLVNLIFPAMALMSVSSCQDYDANFSEEALLKQEYAEQFEKMFGKVDPNQDWSMATRATANVNLPEIKGNSKMNIMTGDPRLSSTRLLGQIMLSDGKGNLTFDAIKGVKKVFVTIESNNEYKVFGEYPIVNGCLNLGVVETPATRAFTDPSEDCPVVNDGAAYNIGITYSPLSDPTATKNIQVQYLSGVETAAADPWTCGWGYSMFSEGQFFQEYKCYYGDVKYGADKLYTDEGLAKVENGFAIKTSATGVIEFPFIFGATQNSNQFGYVIYDDDQDPLTQPHYILMNDGRPKANVFKDSWQGGTANGWSSQDVWHTWIEPLEDFYEAKDNGITCRCNSGTGIYSAPLATGERLPIPDHADYCGINHPDWNGGVAECTSGCPAYNFNQDGTPGDGVYSGPDGNHGSNCYDPMKAYIDRYNEKAYGTRYRLAWFDEEENKYTYNIPSGKNIVFFICQQEEGTKMSDTYSNLSFNYSLPELNKRINHLYTYTDSPLFETGNNESGHENARGIVKATAWTADGKTFLGFEDGTDNDLNDIIFLISGSFTTTTNITKFGRVKWHMNLNGTHDTTDGDLFHSENIEYGKTYTQPASNPSEFGRTFMGWATSPNGTPIAGSKDDPSTITGTVNSGEICYYAIWDTTPVQPDPEWVSWIFACEDLGGTFDYDFNDVVWEVRHDGGSGKVQARLLAAGGTLPFTLQYDGNKICTKAEVYGESNVTTVYISQGSDWYDVLTDPDWTITAGSSNFCVVVEGSGTSVNITTTPTDRTPNNKTASKTPQVILVPGNWAWPTEGTCIKDAYKNFTQWTFSAEMTGWTDSKQTGKTVSR